MLSRRPVLLASSSVLALALAGCSTPTPTPTPPPVPPPTPPLPQNIWEDIQAVMTFFENMLPDLGFLPAGLGAKIAGWVDQARQIVASIQSVVTSGGSVTALVSQFMGIVQQILGALSSSGVTLPGWLGEGITALQFLLPVILAFLGTGIRRRAVDPVAEAAARQILLTVRPPVSRRRAGVHVRHRGRVPARR